MQRDQHCSYPPISEFLSSLYIVNSIHKIPTMNFDQHIFFPLFSFYSLSRAEKEPTVPLPNLKRFNFGGSSAPPNKGVRLSVRRAERN